MTAIGMNNRVYPRGRGKDVADAVLGAVAEDRERAARGSKSLMRALLIYGLNNDSDLGMGVDAFYAAVHAHRISIPVNPGKKTGQAAFQTA